MSWGPEQRPARNEQLGRIEQQLDELLELVRELVEQQREDEPESEDRPQRREVLKTGDGRLAFIKWQPDHERGPGWVLQYQPRVGEAWGSKWEKKYLGGEDDGPEARGLAREAAFAWLRMVAEDETAE